MNKSFAVGFTTLAVVFLPLSAFGHAWSAEMRVMLEAPTPAWMSVGEPIKVEAAGATPPGQISFRTPAGNSESTRTRVMLPSSGIEIKVDYYVDWYFGSSLSPDGTKLIINGESKTRLLSILADGSYKPAELQVPYVTYDDGPKGFVYGWFWVGNDMLMANAEIDTERGEFLEKRFYVFDVKHSMLRRLDFSALKLETTETLEIKGVGEDLSHLQFSAGGKDITVKADLHTPPANGKTTVTPVIALPGEESPARGPATSSAQSIGASKWLLWTALALAFITMLWLVIKRRCRRKVPSQTDEDPQLPPRAG